MPVDSKTGFYSCRKLISSLDKEGKKPAFFIACSRARGVGKTYDFVSALLEKSFKTNHRSKFALFCRTQAELGGVAEGTFKSVLMDKYPGWSVIEKKRMTNTFSDVFIQKEIHPDYEDIEDGKPVKIEYETRHIGYVTPLNSAQRLKSKSSLFVDVDAIYFDEFMPELATGYISNEIEKFQLLYGSMARGQGKSVRYIPVYMTSNTITLDNPYFEAFGLYKYIQADTKFFKGVGVVFEQVFNDAVVEEHANSAFNRAFSQGDSNKLIDYEDEDLWYNSNKSGVTKPNDWGYSNYIGTIISEKTSYGVYIYPQMGFLYISHAVDKSAKAQYRLNVDVNKDVALVKHARIAQIIAGYLKNGTCFFDSVKSKRVALEITGYK